MTSTAIHIDFETRSNVDLKTAGTHPYACHPSTDVWCMAYAIGNGEIQLWEHGSPFPQDILDFVASGEPYHFVAHNAHFELVIWNFLCVPRYGWPKLPPHRIFCTMAMAYAMALPGSLENAANATGMEAKKDLDGRRLMIRMASPRRVNEDGSFLWWDDSTRLERLYAYCKNDVLVERELEKRLRPLSPYEREVWLLDYEINLRGIRVDKPAITRAMTAIAKEKDRLDQEIRVTSHGLVHGISDVIGMREYMRLTPVAMAGVAKPDIIAALKNPALPSEAETILKLRQEGAKSSTAKLKAMSEAASNDDRVRGTMQYHGAGTGRTAGRKIQPQNYPRGELNLSDDAVEEVIAHIDDPEYLSAFYGPPMTVISDVLRALIIAAPGHDFIAADYSSIEAVVLAWLACEQSVLDIFARKDDIYKHAASRIYCLPPDRITKPQRQVGKTAVLALGFQGGAVAFQNMARNYSVDMAPVYPTLTAIATSRQIALSEGLYERYLKKKPSEPIPHDVYIASDLTKRMWREAHPNIVSYWRHLEEAAMAAVRDPKHSYDVSLPTHHPHRVIRYKKSGSFLWCRLPSGRLLCYPYPKIKEIRPEWNDEDDLSTKPTLIYMGTDSLTKAWKPCIAYGGLLAENVTQAVARDFLVHGIFQAEENGYPVTFHVHDEIITEVPEDFGSVEELEKLITTPPTWGFDCPIAAKGWRGFRYRK